MAEPAPAAEQRNDGRGGGIMQSVIRGLVIFSVLQFIMGKLGGSPSADSTAAPSAAPSEAVYERTSYPVAVNPIWPTGTRIDFSVWVSEDPNWVRGHSAASGAVRVVEDNNYRVGDATSYKVEMEVPITEAARNNGSLYMHMFMTRDPANTVAGPIPESETVRVTRSIFKYMPLRREKRGKHLLGDAEDEGGSSSDAAAAAEATEHEPGSLPIVAYYHPNITLSMVPNSVNLAYAQAPPPLRQHIHIDSQDRRDATGRNGYYYPIVYFNEFWQLKDHMMRVNESVSSLPLYFVMEPLASWKMNVYVSLDESLRMQQQQKNPLGQVSSGAEIEEIKRIFLETNVYLLGVTIIVSCLHSLFEFLAFKNDISHWRQKKDNVGVSFRSILSNVVMQLTILLYLIDSSEETSWVILGTQAFGILIEAWKITKAVDVKVVWVDSLVPVRVRFEDKHQLSETERQTDEADQVAYKYLIWVAIPLLVAYAVYSLYYDTHKSWYSFVVKTLVGFAYTWGFMTMIPGLYINYKLKSVAHMPARTLVYKFLNTIVDDFFSFVVTMPLLHRIACFRDDVVFIIYLYQCWIYKVDTTRANEFGQVVPDESEEKKNN